MKLFLRAFTSVAISFAALALVSIATHAQIKPIEKKIGKYAITIRVPEAIYAEEVTDIEFRLGDTSNNDPVLGAEGVIRAKTLAKITMPAMPGMPAQKPKIHTEGVPGDYGIETYFPHGGEYLVELELTAPGETMPIKVSFTVDVKDAEAVKNRKPKPKPFFLEITNKPVAKAGEPTPLVLAIREMKTKAIVKEFDIAHEKLFHLIMVSKDLGWFVHEHPEPQADGTFTISQTFPAGGEYRVFADVAPKGAGSNVLLTVLKVSGDAPTWNSMLKPTPTTTEADGVRAQLKFGENPLPIGKTTPLTFLLTDAVTSKPITDLEPYLGAMGHLLLIHQDGQTFVHSHPMEDDIATAAAKGGSVAFNARFPKPGIYKAWGQFQRGGKVVTLSFVMSVEDKIKKLTGK
ncbi:MAG: FixH family protein [Armatimonadetes bacterium]|nr:FixH family protein [Armatimonadota bacterium]